ncbi:hypothetical protein AtNW77_Chr1g0036801 [Arabidopsis thaliana]|uniref:Uncharacterized protein n=3 Tax=Arabidopsis TaxID=3701 RepID=A0A8T2H8S8_ARASU|nr:hypothetical protein ISN45_At01g032710 [Arabidopsis thaliana x Arabidopsis arenosa]KAG7656228.1 hypothetical protein ISN44_As01g032320 [Arabidopsis suecica]OAP14863.1 hypothetical protein AXX17_AT1G33630 [Arabidopsis thaliana]CAA0263314.1 unnamed protein product [Arabidopsis thaliana]CAD5314338.1 unnamed protein product [Arabidopsis thaliana]
MNSMFSAFDALFAEVMGKNLMASSFTATTATTKPAAAPQTQTQEKANASSKKIGLVQKTPRFALELDGLHCFETIVRS